MYCGRYARKKTCVVMLLKQSDADTTSSAFEKLEMSRNTEACHIKTFLEQQQWHQQLGTGDNAHSKQQKAMETDKKLKLKVQNINVNASVNVHDSDDDSCSVQCCV